MKIRFFPQFELKKPGETVGHEDDQIQMQAIVRLDFGGLDIHRRSQQF